MSQTSHILVPQFIAFFFTHNALFSVVNLTPASYSGATPSSGQLRLKLLTAVTPRKTVQDRTKHVKLLCGWKIQPPKVPINYVILSVQQPLLQYLTTHYAVLYTYTAK